MSEAVAPIFRVVLDYLKMDTARFFPQLEDLTLQVYSNIRKF
jgi:hypothetical protein